MNLLDLTDPKTRIFSKILREQAEKNGDTEFLVNDQVRITFAEADAITNALAGGLARLGVGKGDRVALFMGSRPEMVLLTLAINKLSAIWHAASTVRTTSAGPLIFASRSAVPAVASPRSKLSAALAVSL